MDAISLQSELAELALVKRFYFYEETDSTMQQGRRMVSAVESEYLHGTLLVANYQSSGRGRHGRSWVSPPGKSLLVTLILSRKNLPLYGDNNQGSLLAAVVPVAIARGLMEYLRDVRIKYPNDIVHGERKIAGALIETSGDYFLVGFGINCGHNIDELPSDMRMPASSIFLESKRQISREAILVSVLKEFERMLEPGLYVTSTVEMNSLCETLGKTVCLDLGERTVSGTAKSIADDGSLLIATDAGLERIFSTQVVRTWLPDMDKNIS